MSIPNPTTIACEACGDELAPNSNRHCIKHLEVQPQVRDTYTLLAELVSLERIANNVWGVDQATREKSQLQAQAIRWALGLEVFCPSFKLEA